MRSIKLKVILVLIPILLLLIGISMLFKTHLTLGPHTGPFTVVTYNGEHPLPQRTIPPGSDQERAIQNWIDTHQTGWRLFAKNYPNGPTIRGRDFTLTFEPDLCVASFRDPKSGDSQQAILKLSGNDAPPSVFDH